MGPIHLSVAARTDRGRARRTNEDAFVVADLTRGDALETRDATVQLDVGERGVLLAVSDGLGGHAGGAVASALVVEALARELATPAPVTPPAHVKDAIRRAHHAVQEAAHADGLLEGMGATLTALLVDGASAYIAEVGDSRAYLVRSGAIQLLTHDQSYTQLLVDVGAITPDQVERSPMRNVLLQSMGQGAPVRAEIAKLELCDRDRLVICSDGLTNEASDEDIRMAVLMSPDLPTACTRLVDLANERGGRDDITVIVAGVEGGSAPGPEPSFKVLERFEPRTTH